MAEQKSPMYLDNEGRRQICEQELKEASLILADKIFAIIRKEFPIMYRKEADFVGRLLERGWIPPAEAKKYVKLADIVKFLKKQGAVWVDKNYVIIEAIESEKISEN